MKSETQSDQECTSQSQQLKLTSVVQRRLYIHNAQGAEGRLHLVKDSVPPRTQNKR